MTQVHCLRRQQRSASRVTIPFNPPSPSDDNHPRQVHTNKWFYGNVQVERVLGCTIVVPPSTRHFTHVCRSRKIKHASLPPTRTRLPLLYPLKVEASLPESK